MTTESRAGLRTELRRLVQFTAIGGIGFLVNLAVLYALKDFLGLYPAATLAFVAAATSTWFGNRVWTFRDKGHARMHRQWAVGLMTNLLGFAIYGSTFYLVGVFVPVARDYPALASLAGAAAGLGVNFTLSRKLVFR